MTRDTDPVTDPIGDYFEMVVDDLADEVYDAASPMNVLDETHTKRGITGYGVASGISSLLGGGGGRTFEEVGKRLFEDTVDEVTAYQTDRQKAVVLECADEKHTGTLTEEGYQAYEDAFVDGFREWSDRLNPEARERMNAQMRTGFEELTDLTAYFMQYDGDTFEERLEQAPDDEAREQLQAVVDYVVDIRDALDACEEVYARQRTPLGDTFYVQEEGVRIMDEVVIPHVRERAEEPFRGDGR